MTRVWRAIDLSRMAAKNKLFLKLCLMYGCRNGELRLAEKAHFDFEKQVWTVPAGNHRLGHATGKPLLRPITPETEPLLKQAITMSERSKHIFTNAGTDEPMGTSAPLALANQHVAVVREEKRVLAHQFDGEDDIRAIVGNHAEFQWPLDLAVLPVDMSAWADATKKSKAIEPEQISLGHDPVPGELLAFTGFAGQNVSFHFNTLIAKGTCYTTREIELPPDDRFSSRIHFGLDYRPDLASGLKERDALPLPPGLSGSTVWNTGFMAARLAGVQWTPDQARVTTIIWGWPSGAACLVATRAEFVRSFLLQVAMSGL